MAEISNDQNSTAGFSGASIIKALNIGSGVNIQELAQSLADAENQPKMSRITGKIAEKESSISGFAVLSNSIEGVKTALANLNDLSELSQKKGSVTDSTKLEINEVTGDAIAGSYAFTVSQLASAQQFISNSAASSSTALNSGSAFNLSVSVGAASPVSSTIAVSSDTPQGVVDAINRSSTGLKAFLVQESASGTEVEIMIQGPSGAEGAFTVSSTPNLGFSNNGGSLPVARNAVMTLNGLSGIERASNTISDLIPGTSISLKSTISSAVTVSVAEDHSVAKESIQGLVESYNSFEETVDELLNSDSENYSYSGSLEASSSTVRLIKQKLRDALLATSSTQSNSITALRDLGVSLDRYGKFSVDSTKIDAALTNNFSDVAAMLSANTDGQTEYSSDSKGLALDATIILDNLLDKNGIIANGTANSRSSIESYQSQLEKLESRLAAAYERYIQQFSKMEALVQKSSGTGDYLTGQFEAMANMYKD